MPSIALATEGEADRTKDLISLLQKSLLRQEKCLRCSTPTQTRAPRELARWSAVGVDQRGVGGLDLTLKAGNRWPGVGSGR